MNIQWESKVGPAAVVGIFSIVSTLIGLGVLYGAMNGQISAAATNAIEAKTAASEAQKDSKKRDDALAGQSERIGRIETSLSFVVPSLQRIEAAVAKR